MSRDEREIDVWGEDEEELERRRPPLAPGKRPMVAQLMPGVLLRSAEGGEAPSVDSLEFPTSGGAALPPSARGKFERSLGEDLSAVRVHTGSESARAARSVSAKAFAVGNDIHFAAGHYDPFSMGGELLLAHEVAHTVQQSGGALRPQFELEVSQPGDALEVQADSAAAAMVAGRPAQVSVGATARISRTPDGEGETPKEEEGLPEELVKQLRALVKANDEANAKVATITSAATEAGAAIARADAGAASAAANRAASTATAVEKRIEDSETAIESAATKPGADKDEAFKNAKSSTDGLKEALYASGPGAVGAIALPGMGAEPVGPPAGAGGEVSAAIKANLTSVLPIVGRVAAVRDRVTALSGQPPAAQLAAAQSIKAQVEATHGDEGAYLKKVLAGCGGPPLVMDYINGNTEPLVKAAHGPAVSGSQGKSAASSDGASAPGTGAMQMPAEMIQGSGGGFDQQGSLSVGPGGKVTAGGTLTDPNSKVSAGGSATVVVGPDGEIKLEGYKYQVGYTMPGGSKISAEAGRTVTMNPPVYNGKQWLVSYSVAYSGGLGGSKDKSVLDRTSKHKASVLDQKGTGSGKLGGKYTAGGSKLFPTPEAAKAFYEAGKLKPEELPAGIPGSLEELKEMGDGETRMVAASADAGVSGSSNGFSVGGSGGYGRDAQLTKKPGGKVHVTVRGVVQGGVQAGGSSIAVGGGVGGGAAHSTSTTVIFDTSTPAGAAAYAQWQSNPLVAPPAGPGVTVATTGEGTSVSRTESLRVLHGSGQTTTTAGEFKERTADGKHEQTTIYGTKSETTQGFDLTKRTKTESLEISSLDKGDPTYTIKTSIDKKDSAADTSSDLAKSMGGTGKYWKKGKASGKWDVEGTYSKGQMNDFMKKVEDGSFKPSRSVMRGDEGVELQKALKNAKSDKERQKALAEWFSERGSDAKGDLKDVLGPPTISISLAGDKYLTGAVGQAEFDGKLEALRGKLHDAKIDEKGLKSLRLEIRALFADLMEKRRHIQNPSNYPDLPDAMRNVALSQVGGNAGLVNQLQSLVESKLNEKGVDTSVDPDLLKAIVALGRSRKAMEDARQMAMMNRDVHEGMGARSKESARERLNRTLVMGRISDERLKEAEKGGKGLSATEQLQLARQTYDKADLAWKNGNYEAKEGEKQEQKMMREDTLEPDGKASARLAANASAFNYDQARKHFRDVSRLMAAIAVGLKSQMPREFAGYEAGAANEPQ